MHILILGLILFVIIVIVKMTMDDRRENKVGFPETALWILAALFMGTVLIGGVLMFVPAFWPMMYGFAPGGMMYMHGAYAAWGPMTYGWVVSLVVGIWLTGVTIAGAVAYMLHKKK